MKKIICTVTNDLNYDQRMQRICTSLSANGYNVMLVGVLRKSSTTLSIQNFEQKRLKVFFQTSFLFYAEYNVRLFLFLLFNKFDVICSIDLDTIMAGYFASIFKGKKRVYDAHELFTQMNEVINNKPVFIFWTWVEKIFVPRFKMGYTVNHFMKQLFKTKYKVDYEVVKNIPLKSNLETKANVSNTEVPFLIYQGVVNNGRAFEQLIPAMHYVENIELRIYGKGDIIDKIIELISLNKVQEKIKLMGPFLPPKLKEITPTAQFGITIFDKEGMNQYHSLANRFFDYMMAGIPQICVNYPEYKSINDEYNFALLIDDIEPLTIAKAINKLNTDKELYNTLKTNAITAREKLNWENEQQKLIHFWSNLFL